MLPILENRPWPAEAFSRWPPVAYFARCTEFQRNAP